MRLLFSLICMVLYSASAIGGAENDAFQRGVQVGRFIAGTKGLQELVQGMYDYCVLELPEKKEQFNKAADSWNERNLPIVANWKSTIANYLAVSGVSKRDVPIVVKMTEDNADISLAPIRSGMKATIESFAALTSDERQKACSQYFDAVSSGEKDIKLVSPNSAAFHEKYFRNVP